MLNKCANPFASRKHLAGPGGWCQILRSIGHGRELQPTRHPPVVSRTFLQQKTLKNEAASHFLSRNFGPLFNRLNSGNENDGFASNKQSDSEAAS